jgi:Ca-activated chloride channel homolog
MIGALSFAEPLSLLLLVVLIPLGGLSIIDRRRRGRADAAYGGEAQLRHGRSAWRTRLRMASLAIGVVLVVLATARPRWGTADLPVERRGIDIAIVLDVSRSMTATDVLPSRAAAAAAGLQTLLTHVRSDRAGLVIFAGEAFERSPLTLDMNALQQLVAQAQREALLVERGTDLGAAIDAALQLLAVEDAASTQVMVVVSDGEDLGDGALSAAGRASDAGVAIFTVAAGTESGAPIPGSDRGTAPSRADRITLEAVAARTGGEFRELDAMAGLAIEFQRLHQSVFDEETELQPIERFQWFLAPAIALLALQLVIAEAGRLRPLTRSRVGILGVTAIMLIVGCGGSQLYQHIEAGNEAYEDQRYEDALTAYREARLVAPDEPAVGYNLGNTLHQLRRFEEAAVLSTEALNVTEDPRLAQSLRYALGGHAVERGLLFEARAHYIDVLRADPLDQDARANLELVLGMIDPTATPPPEDSPPPDDDPSPAPTSGPSDSERIGDGGSDVGQPPINDDPGGDSGQDGDGSAGPSSDPDSPGSDQPAGPSGQPGDTAGGTDAAGEGSESNLDLAIAQAEAALLTALADAGEELTVEQALLLLELSSELSALQSLDAGGATAGGATDR